MVNRHVVAFHSLTHSTIPSPYSARPHQSTHVNLILGPNIPIRFYGLITAVTKMGFSGGTVVKNLPANAEDEREAYLIPMSGESPGVRNDSILVIQ